MTLRPLGLGEILDRAVNLCVQNSVVLGPIFVAYAVPLALLRFYSGHDSWTTLEAVADALRRPQPHGAGNDFAAAGQALAAHA